MIKPLARYEQTITVSIRSQVGVDENNNPTYSWTDTEVSGVLVTPQEPVDLSTSKWDSIRQEGHQAKVFVWIPKTCTLNFENARLKIGDYWFNVIGIPQPYYNPPTRWNQYVIAERETG